MIEHVWSVLCSDSVIDRSTNNVSIFNVLEQIQAVTPREPEEGVTLPIRAQVVSLWHRVGTSQPEVGEARVVLQGPDEQVILRDAHVLELTKSRLRTRLLINGLPIRSSASYAVVVEYRQGEGSWNVATKLPLEVEFSVISDEK
jgi:hypothetical protein